MNHHNSYKIFLLTCFSISLFSFAQTYTPGAGVIDGSGNNYNTVIINNLEWMSENLYTTKYSNGDDIQNITDESQWFNLNTGAWAYYNNDLQFEPIYGKMYNWFTIEDTRNLCPTNWHVPTDSEWTTLSDYLGGTNIAGGKMKSTGTTQASNGLWLDPNVGADNSIGFNGHPGGVRNASGLFGLVNQNGNWWTSTEYDSDFAWCRNLNYWSSELSRLNYDKNIGFSVRCVKNYNIGLEKNYQGSDMFFSAFPNPFLDIIRIKIKNNEASSLTIINSLGQIVFEKKLTELSFDLNLSFLNDPGIYLINIKNSNNTTLFVKRVMKS